MNTPRRLMFLQAFSSDAESHLAFILAGRNFECLFLFTITFLFLSQKDSMAITVYNAWANYMYVA